MSHTIPMGAPEHAQRGRPHIFVVNGAPDFFNLMRELLQDEAYNVTTTNYVPATFQQIGGAAPDVLILDLAVGQRAGWDLLAALHADAATAGIPVILVSTDRRHLALATALADRYGPTAVLQKPFDLDEMLALVAAALDKR
ncbi:MAG TPA: response regulator [Thermomicrobiales bacterium]|jgi:CheY-like chemotaxis protein